MDRANPRLHTLDALRGAAALAVVFYHWRHFADLDGGFSTAWRLAQPFYGVLPCHSVRPRHVGSDAMMAVPIIAD